MSPSRRSSLSPPQQAESTRELKHRVITCINKLSDRDTLAVATAELEFIARNLTHDLYSPFLTCIHTTDPAEKSPVRKQCVRLLGLLSESHGDALSPHVSKMISTIIRRLRDPGSSVRLACIDAVTVMSLQITKPPFSVFLKSFMDVISTEQDHNSQLGSALCLAAMIDAVPDPEPPLLLKVLPKLLKLSKSESFKAKPALLSLIGSVVSAGGASSRVALDCLVPSMIEFLCSEDWAARKAAAEVLGKIASVDRIFVAEYKRTCLGSLDSRRFDKVKVVRDAMNSTLDSWKKVDDVCEVLPSSQSQSQSCPRDNSNKECFPVNSKISQNVAASETKQFKKATSTAVSPLLPTNRTKNKSLTKKTNAMSYKLDYNPNCNSFEGDIKKESKISELAENENNKFANLETKRVLFKKIFDEKMQRFGQIKSGPRVVPVHESEYSESGDVDEVYEDHKDIEDMNLIRKQLVQIENQQSNLLEILQRFIGSSQNGINSLESRVHGLEMALHEISYDLAVSTGSISHTDSTGNACCKLPGTEFLSPKLWRRTEGRYSSPRLQQQNIGGFVGNSSETYYGDRSCIIEPSSNGRTFKNLNRGGAERAHGRNAGELDGSSNVVVRHQ